MNKVSRLENPVLWIILMYRNLNEKIILLIFIYYMEYLWGFININYVRELL
jgi:hypothetical protein